MVDSYATEYDPGTKPPLWPAILSVVGIAVSGGLAADQSLLSSLLSSVGWRHAIGWGAGAFVPVFAFVLQRRALRSLQGRPDFYSTWFRTWSVVVLLFVGLVVGAWNAWQAATWWAL